MVNGRNSYPFTPSQWQELEHQALIYKYMASGISIPPYLLLTLKRTHLDFDSSRLFPHQHFEWNYLPMGLGRKIDPEPGRCRRTDGKKWRCSKDAYPDSKYCERHMHRGKNRSRKPVEVLKTTTKIDAAALTPTTTHSLTTSLSSHENTYNHYPHHSPYASSSSTSSHLHHSFPYHHSSSRPSSFVGFSFQDRTGPLFQDNTTTDSRNRYVYGLKEDVDEHAFFTEPSGTMRSSSMDDPWQLTPLTISSSSSKQRNCSGFLSSSNENEYSYLQLQSLTDKCETFMKHGKKEEEPHQKTTVHHFFDEWPPKSSRNSWLDLDDKSSTTQLSISTTQRDS